MALITFGVAAQGQDPQEDSVPQSRWAFTADFGLAITEGNSETDTFEIDSELEWKSERSSFRVKLGGLQSSTADDRFRQVDPGFTWLVGEDPPDVTTSLVDPAKKPDVDKFATEIRYDRSVSRKSRLKAGKTSWHAGTSWERDLGAGLLSRSSLFAGLGHTWWDREDLKFDTSYSLSYTDRDEETPDPDKEDQFAGIRLAWRYENRWGQRVTYANDLTSNISLEDTGDYTSSLMQSVSVPISERLSLKVRLEWRYASLPAFEDIGVSALTILVDPDGTPGSGDEFFQTVASAGTAIELDSVRERKKELDTVFSTSITVQLGRH